MDAYCYSCHTKVYNGGHLASSFSFPRSSAAPATFGRVYFDAPKPRRFQVLALSVKRSPKPQILRSLASPRSSLSVLKFDPSQSGADSWKLEPVVDLLKQVAVGVVPTDTVYALVCGLRNNSAIERLRRIKNIDPLNPLASYATPSTTLIHIRQGFPAVMAKVTQIFSDMLSNAYPALILSS
ncbi:hypothetical protein FF1_011380 [Malus domestica]